VLIEGSSTSEEVIAQVYDYAQGAERTLVVLDSHHTKDHVARELELYSPIVSKDSYLVVFDTVLERMPPDAIGNREWGHGNNPWNAVEEFLSGNDRFVVDRMIDAKLIVSVAPSGYLRCVRDAE
jgi:cephalosporin hydroxylase